jgi:hypothetical protein
MTHVSPQPQSVFAEHGLGRQLVPVLPVVLVGVQVQPCTARQDASVFA